ncbi:MAG: TIGR02221 family CRISPR-associated protein [Chloroflexales bacterium]|nr:TIGR02221 family CRISPR-associated protein [Chloroflexales bacterium]
MPTKAITFLGYTAPDRPYRETTYVWESHACTTPFMAEATAHFFRPDQLLVLVTAEARAQNFADLERRIGDQFPLHPVDIPSGRSEDELWIMFDAIASAIEPSDHIIFDITNGFRSLPVLAVLAASYVRLVRDATVDRVVYGAYDAATAGQTPVFDLTPFVQLLDWTTAADRFIRDGDSRDLADLIRKGMPPGAAMRDDQNARELGKALKQAANAMEQISRALRMTRPLETMSAGAALADALASEQPSKARPFRLLAERVRATYAPFAIREPDAVELLPVNLYVQLELIDWYCSKDQIVQAITLAREWIISLLCQQTDSALMDRDGARTPIEHALNRLARTGSGTIVQNALESAIQALRHSEETLRTWNRLTELRNDVAHAGMRANPRTAQQLVNDFTRLLPDLRRIASQFDWFPTR